MLNPLIVKYINNNNIAEWEKLFADSSSEKNYSQIKRRTEAAWVASGSLCKREKEKPRTCFHDKFAVSLPLKGCGQGHVFMSLSLQ